LQCPARPRAPQGLASQLPAGYLSVIDDYR
jgi:hypothetical protein